jgi:hypothetical protein
MALENGRIRGVRVVGKFLQRGTGRLEWSQVPFDEGFDGEFSDIVLLPLTYSYNMTAGEESWESIHASCQAAGPLQGRTLLYPPASAEFRPSSVSAMISMIPAASSDGEGGELGIPIVGISLGVKEAPVTIPSPPCGPIPWTFFKFPEPLQPNPYASETRNGSAGQAAWVGSLYGRRGWATFA